MLKKVNNLLLLIIIACFCVLTWASVFVWHSCFCAVAFTACILVCLFYWEGRTNDE